jgi:hypothetical protein
MSELCCCLCPHAEESSRYALERYTDWLLLLARLIDCNYDLPHDGYVDLSLLMEFVAKHQQALLDLLSSAAHSQTLPEEQGGGA